MKRYQRMKTTLGHRYYVRMTEDELAERELFCIALVALPFVSAALMFFLWIRMG